MGETKGAQPETQQLFPTEVKNTKVDNPTEIGANADQSIKITDSPQSPSFQVEFLTPEEPKKEERHQKTIKKKKRQQEPISEGADRPISSLRANTLPPSRLSTKAPFRAFPPCSKPPSQCISRQVPKYFFLLPSVKPQIKQRSANSQTEQRLPVLESLDDFTKSILDGQKPENPPSLAQLQSSSHQLKLLQKDYVQQSLYIEAKKAADCEDFVKELLSNSKANIEKKNEAEVLFSKRNELVAYTSYIAGEWDQTIRDYRQKMKQREEEIIEEQKCEIEHFDSITPHELAPLFDKNSVMYFKMRSKEKSLAENRRFEEAQAIKEMADAMQEKEEEVNAVDMEKFYKRRRRRLKQMQKRALDHFREYTECRVAEMKASKEGAIKGALDRAKQIDGQIDGLLETGSSTPDIDTKAISNEMVEQLKAKDRGEPVSKRRVASSIGGRYLSSSASIHRPIVQGTVKV